VIVEIFHLSLQVLDDGDALGRSQNQKNQELLEKIGVTETFEKKHLEKRKAKKD
jgi:hypothetical protein